MVATLHHHICTAARKLFGHPVGANAIIYVGCILHNVASAISTYALYVMAATQVKQIYKSSNCHGLYITHHFDDHAPTSIKAFPGLELGWNVPTNFKKDLFARGSISQLVCPPWCIYQ